jgi:threonylcarbamoyladenosine tRNA methylthiotransferase MtaB
MPHLHLSLQSGSDTTLAAMRRGYTAAEYFNAVTRARAALDQPAFTTDVIVGFPGETETHFEESYTFCQTIGFSKMHIFTYSPRPKTIAAGMPNQINGAIATERSERLHALGESMALNFHRQFVGTPVNILVEQQKDGLATGYTQHYIPVELKTPNDVRGQIVSVTADTATADGLQRS